MSRHTAIARNLLAFGVALSLMPAALSGAPTPSGREQPQPPESQEGQGSQQAKPKPPEKPKPTAPHDHSAPQKPGDPKEYPPGIPPITDEDRAAAFPDLHGQHAVHDRAVHYFVLFDQLEWQAGDGISGLTWDNKGWVGGDVNRFWFRTEGSGEDGRVADAQAHALYGRAIHRWWDLIAGVRQDFEPGPARTWAAVGIQGLAPYSFEVEATAYVGESGRTHFRFETEYELLLTNRFILQPLAELDVYGKDDVERGIAAGVSSLDAGLRFRYEFRREIAPYVGIAWDWKFAGTAELAEAAGEKTNGARLVIGVRAWF